MIEDKQIQAEYDLKELLLAKIYTFGSYRLGVNTHDSDVDCLCVTVKPIEKTKHFFKIFFLMLKSNENVKNLIKIEHAYVPVIKMVFHGV